MKAQEDVCPYCNSHNLTQNEQGNSFCQDCHYVIQKTSLANTVQFGNLKMLGKVVDRDEKNNKGSIEKRLNRAREKIYQLNRLLEIEHDYEQAIDAAVRVIRYANDYNFFDKGRNVELYAAAALYITLRFKKAPYLLIDFSDKMNVNLFKLGRCFLKLSRFMGFQDQLPLIDPSLFIHRYCRMLDLGEKTKQVTMTAIRLVQRMKRDWMCQGRRPSSLCGAAILIATKIHDVKCSTNEICKTVFVCDETIRRRLEQFKQTNVAKLTREEFEKMENNLDQIEGEMDPPAFTKARLRSEQEKIRKQVSIAMIKKAQMKEKEPNIEWSSYKNNLNIPEELFNTQVKEVQKGFVAAKERFSGDDSIDENEQLRSMTEGSDDQIFDEESNIDQMQNEQNSEIKDEQIDKYILTEEQQKVKKNLWKKINCDWLAKQQFRKKQAEKVVKRKIKKNASLIKNDDPFQAVKNTKLGENVNDQELKRLLGSEPKKPKPQQKVQLTKIFNPFEWNI